MPSIQKCPKCGFELTDTSSSVCPVCGTPRHFRRPIAPGARIARCARIWIGALVQFAFMTTFMLVFRFPKILIAFFGVMIVLGTALTGWAKRKQLAPRPPQRPLSHPTLFKVLSLGIAFCSLVLFSTLLFGFVMFVNNWNDWHRYQGQPYHRTEFVVAHTYYQRGSKGAVDAYASGMVDGKREWMSLRPYLPTVPRSEAELDEQRSRRNIDSHLSVSGNEGQTAGASVLGHSASGRLSPRSDEHRRLWSWWRAFQCGSHFRADSSQKNVLRGNRFVDSTLAASQGG